MACPNLSQRVKNNISHYEEDFKIAKKISSKYGFKLNKFSMYKNSIKFDLKDSLYLNYYTKLGFHKSFNLHNSFYRRPIFAFTGGFGGMIRGYPELPIWKYMKKLSSNSWKIKGHEKEYFKSSKRIFNRSVNFLKKKNFTNNDYEISSILYEKGSGIYHFGMSAQIGFMKNSYILMPLMDPYLKQIKFNINGTSPHDLIAYIYIRFAPELISFPIEGNRKLNHESIKKAKMLNKMIIPYKKKSNYNDKFYIDFKRQSPVSFSKADNDEEHHLTKLFKSSKFKEIINRIYDKTIFDWAKAYKNKSKHIPLRHFYGLLAVEKIMENKMYNLNVHFFE